MKQDPRRERSDQDLWLERAEMKRRIREIQEERGSIRPAPKPSDKKSEKEDKSERSG